MHHPYRLPIIGWRHEIELYDREKALAFYRDHYAPNNAILIVAGDVDAEELRPLAERIYGTIPSRELPGRTRVQEPPQEAARRVTLADPRVRQPSLSRPISRPAMAPARRNRPIRCRSWRKSWAAAGPAGSIANW